MGALVMPQHLQQAFKGRRVLVTGDSGFKGSWLSFWLSELGAKVFGYSLTSESRLFGELNLSSRIDHMTGDLRDFSKWNSVVQEFQPEIVFHLAAQALVRKSYRDPIETFSTNVMGSVHVLESLRNISSVKAIVYITSDKCYLNKEWIWGYRESDELGGKDPYSASKACAELVFASFKSVFFDSRPNVGIASVRAGNVVGGGDWSEDRIVPDCVRAICRNEAIVLRNPHSTRPWVHVLEPLYGYLLTATRLLEDPKKYSGSWNFGPTDKPRSVGDLASGIVKQWGKGQVVVQADQSFHEAGLLRLNIDKSMQLLGWQPQWTFDELVRETVAWYRGVLSGENAEAITRRQIETYCERLT
jgi:CDP-glucose 4,6-dehydratase